MLISIRLFFSIDFVVKIVVHNYEILMVMIPCKLFPRYNAVVDGMAKVTNFCDMCDSCLNTVTITYIGRRHLSNKYSVSYYNIVMKHCLIIY